MSWPMIYGALAASTPRTIEFFNFDFEEYAHDADWSEPGWTSGVTWKVYDLSGDNIIYPPDDLGEYFNTTDVSESDVIMTANVKESTFNTESGLLIRYADDNNTLLFVQVRAESVVKLYVRQSGVWTHLASSDPISFPNETFIEYRFESRGNNLLGYRDNVEIISYTLAGTESLGTGVGIFSGHAQPNFTSMSATTAV